MKNSLQQFDDTIHCLANRWSGARPLLPGFSLLARGVAVAPDQIAKETGHNNQEIKKVLEDARCTFNDNGHLIDLFGMMLTPTYHRLECNGIAIFSCCALWAHVIPKLIDCDVMVESIDPSSNELVRLEITPEKVRSVNGQTAVATIAVADATSIARDVGSAFCSHARHFASLNSAREFTAAFPTRRIVEIGELHELANDLYAAIWAQLGDDKVL